jgi:uncharacterized phage-associated protein
MTHSAIQIANEFLDIAERAGRQLTPMQVLKLTYITHGWHLALVDEPLFQDRVEAWDYGPVIPALYHEFKTWGNGAILQKGWADFGAPPRVEDKETIAFLEMVWDTYGNSSGVQLSNRTHAPGTPWTETFIPGSRGLIITDNRIKEHYLGLVAKAQERINSQEGR